jgi:type IV pilus assembly protein PilO
MAMNTKDPRFQKLLLCGLGAAAVGYAFFLTDWLPFTYKAKAGEIRELEGRYAEMSRELIKARQATQSLPYLEREYELLHRKWSKSQALLPEGQDMAWLLRTITVLGTRSGVEFTLFKPLPPRPQQHYTEHPIEITVLGGYHQVGAFLAEMANLDRIIRVDGLEVASNKEKDPEQPAEASFLAMTYTIGGTGVPPEAAAQAAQQGGAPAASGKSNPSAGGTAGGPPAGAKKGGRPGGADE